MASLFISLTYLRGGDYILWRRWRHLLKRGKPVTNTRPFGCTAGIDKHGRLDRIRVLKA